MKRFACTLTAIALFTATALPAQTKPRSPDAKLATASQSGFDALVKKANAALKKKYAASSGYPTIVLLDADGKKLGEEVGYHPGSGPKDYIARLEKITKKGT